MTVEICCGTVEEVRLAVRAGADRIEFNSALETGGVTPSRGALCLAIESARWEGVKSAVMLRPRGGDFCYSRSDFEAMALDGSFLKDEGADYIVFGILKPDGNVDAERCYSMMGQCGSRKTPLSFVFHMAFDETPDWRRALDTLVELKFSRILSKGQAVNAEAGAETLRHMIRYAGSRIEILPGGGVRAHNVRDIIKKTGCDQIHFSLRKNEKEFFSEQEIKDLIALCRRP